MSFRTSITLLFLFALAGSVYVWVGLDTRPRSRNEPRHVFPEWRASDVTRVTIERPGSPAGALVAAREGDAWRIVTPVATPADAGAIAEMLDTVGRPEVSPIPPGLDGARTGLDAPSLTATFALRDGSTRTVAFGNDDLDRRRVFARSTDPGETSTMLVPARLRDALSRTPDDLRDRGVFPIDRHAVERLTLQGRGTLIFERVESYWRLRRAAGFDYADTGRVEELIAALTSLEAKRYVSEAPTDAALRNAGLLPPVALVTLEGGGVTATAGLGGMAPGTNEVYGRRPDRPALFTVDDAFTQKVHWEAAYWKSTRLVHLGTARVRQLTVSPPGGATGVSPVTGGAAVRLVHDGEAWRFTAPVSRTADPQTCADLVAAIEDIEIVKVASERPSDLRNFGLDRPVAVAIRAADGVEEAFRIGRAGPRDGDVYVQSKEGGEVLLVHFPSAPFIAAALETLRDRHLVACAPREIVRLDVDRSGRAQAPAARTPEGDWTVPPGMTLDKDRLEALALEISRLTASHIFPSPAAADLAPTGLDRPWMIVIARRAAPDTRASAQTITLELGLKFDDHERWARCTRRDEATGETDALTLGIAEETVDAIERSLPPAATPQPRGGPDAPAPPTETPR